MEPHTNDLVLSTDGAALNSPLSPLCQKINGYWFVRHCQVSYRRVCVFWRIAGKQTNNLLSLPFFDWLHRPIVHQWMPMGNGIRPLRSTLSIWWPRSAQSPGQQSWVTEQYKIFSFLKATKVCNCCSVLVLHYKCNPLHGCWTASSVVTRGRFQPLPLLLSQLQECWLVIKREDAWDCFSAGGPLRLCAEISVAARTKFIAKIQ